MVAALLLVVLPRFFFWFLGIFWWPFNLGVNLGVTQAAGTSQPGGWVHEKLQNGYRQSRQLHIGKTLTIPSWWQNACYVCAKKAMCLVGSSRCWQNANLKLQPWETSSAKSVRRNCPPRIQCRGGICKQNAKRSFHGQALQFQKRRASQAKGNVQCGRRQNNMQGDRRISESHTGLKLWVTAHYAHHSGGGKLNRQGLKL